MSDLARMTPRQRSHATYLMDVMHRLEWDFHHTIFRGRRIPPEWTEIARATPRSSKVKCTLDIEADVLKFFKSMGKGHGPRMNDVLRAYMHARIAGVIDGAETIAQYKDGLVGDNSPKPAFGDVGRMLGHRVEDEPEDQSGAAIMERAMQLLK
jgi:hypothetical protein